MHTRFKDDQIAKYLCENTFASFQFEQIQEIPILTTILGNNYTRNGNRIGYYSLHFGETGTHTMNFTKTKAYFDDGTRVPNEFEIKTPEYNAITRKFTGSIYFGNNKYFNGARRMYMQFLFSKDFKRIEDGWLQM